MEVESETKQLPKTFNTTNDNDTFIEKVCCEHEEENIFTSA